MQLEIEPASLVLQAYFPSLPKAKNWVSPEEGTGPVPRRLERQRTFRLVSADDSFVTAETTAPRRGVKPTAGPLQHRHQSRAAPGWTSSATDFFSPITSSSVTIATTAA